MTKIIFNKSIFYSSLLFLISLLISFLISTTVYADSGYNKWRNAQHSRKHNSNQHQRPLRSDRKKHQAQDYSSKHKNSPSGKHRNKNYSVSRSDGESRAPKHTYKNENRNRHFDRREKENPKSYLKEKSKHREIQHHLDRSEKRNALENRAAEKQHLHRKGNKYSDEKEFKTNKRHNRLSERHHNASTSRSGLAPRHRIYKRHKHVYHHTPWYNTYYLAPIRSHYHPFGHRIRHLPHSHTRIMIGSLPYFYFSGMFFSALGDDYVVVRAPIGAFVDILPVGFIAFSLGVSTYYYVNDTYYNWDDARNGYLVVEKPLGADDSIKEATSGRLFAYPTKNQDEKLQAKDRYECHRWAVEQSNIDPSEEDITLSQQDRSDYKRAISACLVARDYTVE